MSDYDSSELLGVVATHNLAEIMQVVAKTQAEVTAKDLADTEFENPDFLGGIVFLAKILQRITAHALAAGPGMGMELGSRELAGFTGHILALVVCDMEEQFRDKLLHVPDKGVSVVAWGDLDGR